MILCSGMVFHAFPWGPGGLPSLEGGEGCGGTGHRGSVQWGWDPEQGHGPAHLFSMILWTL